MLKQNSSNSTVIADLAQEAFEQMRNAREIRPRDLIIVGGVLSADKLPEFLGHFSTHMQTDMPWSMIETVHAFKVRERADLTKLLDAKQVFLLERARIFGEAGDLDIRRDGEEFRWRFLGETIPADKKFAETFSSEDFWDAYPDIRFYSIQECHMQWQPGDGRVSTGWFESASLNASATYLEQVHYLRDGEVVFARFLAFTNEPCEKGSSK